MPVPGNPMVPRAPRRPRVNLATRGPRETDAPDLLKFIVTPGANRMRLKNRNPTGHHLSFLRYKPGKDRHPTPSFVVRRKVGYLSQFVQRARGQGKELLTAIASNRDVAHHTGRNWSISL
jgi:hypothetical protein